MLALLSPSKTLDFETAKSFSKPTCPALFDESLKLIDILKNKKLSEIQSLMKLSDKLSELNYSRFQNFAENMNDINAKQAVFAFKGDVYEGLDAETFSPEDLEIINNKVAIISGLYGLLKPLDYIQPYRLEMGTRLENQEGKNLYEFWKGKISNHLNNIEKNTIVNLASEEYFKAIDKKNLSAKIINIHFKEDKNKQVKTIGIFAKKARGLMARFIVENNIEHIDKLKNFNISGYKFISDLSDNNNLTFIRKHD